jgi:peptidoglycan/LPS O-acetylase OafA/YrhL
MHKFRIALAVTFVALAAVSAVDSASALFGIDSFFPRFPVGTLTRPRNYRDGRCVSAMDCIEWRTIMMLRKFRIALAAMVIAVAALSAVDSASACGGFRGGGCYFGYDGGFGWP